MERKLLAICIPTFNRAKALDRLLHNIEKEIGGLESDVEICISDNCSTDGTWGVLEGWRGRLPLNATKRKRNGIYDVNLAESLSLAKADYVWFVGDDDRIAPGAIGRAVEDLEVARRKKLATVYFNAQERSSAVASLPFDSFRTVRKNMMPALNISFLGTVCLRRVDAVKMLRGKLKLSEGRYIEKRSGFSPLYGFLHTYLFLECTHSSKIVGIEPKPMISILGDGGAHSYERQIALNILLLIYALEIRKNYPWFKPVEFGSTFKGHLARMAISCERPAMENYYQTCKEAYLYLLGDSGQRLLEGAVRISDRLRKYGFCCIVLASSFRIAIKVLKSPIITKTEKNPVTIRDLEFAGKRLKVLLDRNKPPEIPPHG